MVLLINIAFADDLGAEPSRQIKGLVPPDLSTFPEMFIKDGNFNAVIVVGDKAPASDVISQSNLIQFFISYIGKTIIGSAKLASEVSTLEQNMISIGSPCHNSISSQIMIEPKPCDKWLEPGKAFILLYYYKGYTHMVIEGYSDKGTRAAADFLVNSKIGSLRGANVLVEVDEPKDETNEQGAKEEPAVKEENITANIEEEKEKLISELTEKIANKSKEQSKKTDNTAITKTKEKISSEQKEAIKTEQKKETNIIKKIIGWISSLFGRSQ
ncbi:hypothetical protein HYX04_04345 [Candidatus Woesearchaeota archaeon]|nr:hypothetical protein [Candidatus Woesearchaeota archaeon]